jgi:hypothetical protein
MKKRLIPVACAALIMAGCTAGKNTAESTKNRSVRDVIPMTEANIQGHRILYNEGWFVVSSTKKSLEYARKKCIAPSRSHLRRIARDIVNRSSDLKDDVSSDWRVSVEQAKNLLKSGTGLSGSLLSGTADLTALEFTYAGDTFADACRTFVQGNISLVKRTSDDLNDLKNLPGHYFEDLRGDFSNIQGIADGVSIIASQKIGVSWEKSFNEAADGFRTEYDRSGTRSNSLSALGDILSGYLKALYSGVAKPSAKSIVLYSVKGASYAVFLPAATATLVSGRTVEATGLSLYYVSKTGCHVIAPTVESGVLGGMSLLSLAAVPITAAGGAGLSAVNQVAFTAAAPAYGFGKGVAGTAIDSGKYAALVTYDLTRENSRVLINYLSTGVVLGYNALTAIPVHLILGTADAAVFLGWDGPRLVVAAASGRLTSRDGKAIGTPGDLPAGTVVDLQALRQQNGVTVTILTDDPAVVRTIFEKMPEDLKTDHEQ